MNINQLKNHLDFLKLVNTSKFVKALDEKHSPASVKTVLYDIIHSKELKKLDEMILTVIQEYFSCNITDWKMQYEFVGRETIGNLVLTLIQYIDFLIRMTKIQCENPLSKFANAILSNQDEQTIYINYLNALSVTRDQLKHDYINLKNVDDVFKELKEVLETNPDETLQHIVDDLYFDCIGKMTP